MYTAAELATAVAYGLDVVVVIVKDGGFGIFRERQRRRFGRTIMVDLRNPDFVALARAFGANGLRVGQPADLADAITWALSRRGPTVLELPISLPAPFDG